MDYYKWTYQCSSTSKNLHSSALGEYWMLFSLVWFGLVWFYTGWNDKIVALEKTIWFHFRLMKTSFLFLLQTIYLLASCVQIPRAIGAFYHVWKWHNVQQVRSEMHRCTTHALYWSKLWQQDHCQHPQNENLDCHDKQGRAQGDENKFSGYGYGLWCGFKSGLYHATSYLRSRLESQHQSVPGCAKECSDPLVQSDGRWQTLGLAAGLGAGPQVQRDPGLASEGVLRLCTLLSLAPLPPPWTRWTTLFGHM